MPIQRTFLGRPIRPMHPRKLAVLLATIALFALITLVFTLPSSIPDGPSLGKYTEHKTSLNKISTALKLTHSHPVAHAPPVQRNSTSGGASWYSNWNWLSPFSSSVTLDESRSLLPPLEARPPIYTYFDHTIKREQDVQDAENALLLTWRRSWWAQGFRPIILSPAESINNPLYREFQMKGLEGPVKTAMSRWLAWENMGTGILCEYLTVPMGEYSDPLLSYLRRGKYPVLTRFDNLGNGLFAGSKAEITAAVKQALANPDLKHAKDFISAVTPETFKIDPKHESLAYYNDAVVEDKYSKIADEVTAVGAKGRNTLNNLIVAHLHSTWQNLFSEGIAVLKPFPNHMSAAIEPAMQLAEFLAACPDSPLPASCPPNRPRCTHCVASSPLRISTPPAYRNTSGLYTIGIVPHPFTMALLTAFRQDVDIPWIRRESERDPWLSRLTQELLGTGVSGAPRVLKFKEAVASPHGTSHSLWMTAEKDVPKDLDWYFGFTIPRSATHGRSKPPVPGPERQQKPEHDPTDGPEANLVDLAKEQILLTRAKEFGKARTAKEEKIRGAIEAWNLADTEAWKFARAFLARSRVERAKWEEEEKKYADGAGTERVKAESKGRWKDE